MGHFTEMQFIANKCKNGPFVWFLVYSGKKKTHISFFIICICGKYFNKKLIRVRPNIWWSIKTDVLLTMRLLTSSPVSGKMSLFQQTRTTICEKLIAHKQPNRNTIGPQGTVLFHLIRVKWRAVNESQSEHSVVSRGARVCVVVQMRANEGSAAWVTARNEVFSDVRYILCRLGHPCRP